jgi:hypothetical protein
MRFKVSALLLLPLVAALGCGSNTPTVVILPPSGDWVLNVAPQTGSASYFSGYLSIQSSGVSGVLRYYNPGTVCVASSQAIPVTGTIDAAGSTMTLTTSAFAGGSVATLTVRLPLISTTIPNYAFGSAQITGGSCALASSSLTANYISYTGTFTGTLTGSATGQVALTVGTPTNNGDGTLAVGSASISFSSPTCNFSSASALSGTVSGYSMQLSNGTINVMASASSSPVSLSVTGGCTGTLAGTVNLQ